MRVLVVMTMMMACMGCEPAPPSAPPPGAAVRREVVRAPERALDAAALRGEERVRFSLGIVTMGPWLVPRESTTIWFEDSSGWQDIPGITMVPDQDGVFRSDWYVTDTRGRLRGAVELWLGAGTTVHAPFELSLEGGTWDVSLFVSENVTTPCMGIYLAERQPTTGSSLGSMTGCLHPGLSFGAM